MSTAPKTLDDRLNEQPIALAEGIHYDVPAAVYHADPCPTPSLSSGIARTMLSKSPAQAYREHPKFGAVKKKRTSAMDAGALVHSILAERPDDFVVGDFDNYLSKAAKEWRDAVLESGRNAALQKHLDNAHRIVASIRANVCNGGMTNDPFAAHGKSEVTIIWKEGDVFCRALPDRMVVDPVGYCDVYDWKVTNDVSNDGIRRSVIKWGYHIQEAFYRRGIAAALPSHAGRISWTFAFVLDVEPYTVRRVCLEPDFLTIGKGDVSRAIRMWQSATRNNYWPDGSQETLKLEAPAWLFGDEISDSITS